MSHWQNRPEPNWEKFQFNQPYSKGLKKLRDVLETTDFDPATLWQWGTMQATALIEVLKATEAQFGQEGQKLVYDALRRVGFDVGSQILKDVEIPEELSLAEFASFYATVINRIVYASLESPTIDNEGQVSFDILWCPHQDHYSAFDCRVQRYFVQGILDAAAEHVQQLGFQVRFESTMPAGAETCHFVLWKADPDETARWEAYTAKLEKKALELARLQRRNRDA